MSNLPHKQKQEKQTLEEKIETRRWIRMLWVVSVLCILIGVAGGWFASKKYENRIKAKVPKVLDVVPDPEGFTIKRGRFGKHQEYVANLQESPLVDTRRVHIQGRCKHFLVITVKYRMQEKEILRSKLEKIQGILNSTVYVGDYTIALEKLCTDVGNREFWSWNFLWPQVNEIVGQHLENQKILEAPPHE